MSTKTLARLFYSFFGLLVVASVGVILAVQFVDWNAYRTTIASLASEQLQLTVDLEGPVNVSLFPGPGFQVSDVTVRPQDGEGDLVTRADLIAVRLSMSDLIGGRFTLESLALQGADLTLVETPDETWVVEGWTPDRADTTSDPVQLNALELTSSTLRLVPQSGAPILIEELAATLSGTLPGGQVSWDASASVGGEAVSVNGRYRPHESGEGFAVLVNGQIGTGEWRVSGRSGDTVPFIGRVELAGADFARDMSALQTALGRQASLTGREQPYDFDVQITENAGITELDGRSIHLGETGGRFSATIATPEDAIPVVTGQVSLAILDLQSMLDFQIKSSGPVGDSEAISLPFVGSIDLGIETVETQAGLIQQVGASLRVEQDRVQFDRMQALLPGGSEALLSGQLALAPVSSFDGRLSIESRNLTDLLDGTGVLSRNSVSLGRLSTADLSAHLKTGEGIWTLDSIRGRIDTIVLTGALSGRVGEIMPLTADLVLEDINLDALLPENTANTDSVAAEQTLAEALRSAFEPLSDSGTIVRLSAAQVVWLGRPLDSIDLSGRVGRNGLVLDQLQMRDGASEVALSGLVQARDDGNWNVDLSGTATNWAPYRAIALAPQSEPLFKAIGAPIDLEVRLNGPISQTVLSGQASGVSGSVAVDGTLDLDRPTEQGLGLQFQAELADFSPVLVVADLTTTAPAPGRITAAVNRESATAPYSIRVGGLFAGGQIMVEGDVQKSGEANTRLEYSHQQPDNAFQTFGIQNFPKVFDSEAITFKGQLVNRTDSWTLQNIDVSGGAGRISGTLSQNASTGLTGALLLSNLTIPLDMGSSSQGSQTASGQALPPIDIQLNLMGVSIAGQEISASNVRLSQANKQLSVDLGQQARLQDGVLSGRATLNLGQTEAWQVSLQADRLSSESLLAAFGYPTLMSGPAQVQMELSGTGTSAADVSASLSGEMSLRQSGGRLNFIDAPALALSVAQSPSITNFLGQIGPVLRSGQSALRGLDVSARFVDGVALLDQFEGQGTWGAIDLTGQVNLANKILSVNGELGLASPPGAPPIELSYSGNLNQPTSKLGSKLFEQFALRQISRRLQGVESRRQSSANSGQSSPGKLLFGVFSGALNQLKQKQTQEQEDPEDGS